MKVKLTFFECIKLGAGFFIGYEIAKNCNEIAGELYTVFKKRIKNNYTA